MKKKKLEPKATIGVITIEKYENPRLESLIDKFEKELRKESKLSKLIFNGSIWIYPL
ncbi:MAG: hypothetical protein AABY44_05715 [Nitrospirota bacterium]